MQCISILYVYIYIHTILIQCIRLHTGLNITSDVAVKMYSCGAGCSIYIRYRYIWDQGKS